MFSIRETLFFIGCAWLVGVSTVLLVLVNHNRPNPIPVFDYSVCDTITPTLELMKESRRTPEGRWCNIGR